MGGAREGEGHPRAAQACTTVRRAALPAVSLFRKKHPALDALGYDPPPLRGYY